MVENPKPKPKTKVVIASDQLRARFQDNDLFHGVGTSGKNVYVRLLREPTQQERKQMPDIFNGVPVEYRVFKGKRV